MLHLQHNELLPKENLLPESYASARKLIEPFLVSKTVYHACPNDCILFRGEYSKADVCPKCNSHKYTNETIPARKFICLPLAPHLTQIFQSEVVSEMLQSHISTSDDPMMYDIHNSPIRKNIYSSKGPFGGDPRGLSIAFCTDGVYPFSHNYVQYSVWPMMITLLNFPRVVRNSFGNIFLLGIIPGNGCQAKKFKSVFRSVCR